ncbi:MAG: polysaccharide pyruvyl transferase family protein [Clostridia bacterium]|nr:polysaccharide pyruvyl transferase family protein [Clostridia bacterium]
MTRVGVMTFLHNDNYGSILQAFALQQVLLDLGYDARHIDYAPDKQEKLCNLLRSGNSPMLILDGMRKKSAAGKMHGGFDEFRAQHIRLTDRCPKHAALTRAAEEFDVLVCGSDQIWSPVWLNPAYFLDFTSRPKVAYAPSLGVQALPGRCKQRRMAALMKPFQAVSVREEEGAALVQAMTGRTPAILPDPVMLLPRERWQSILDADIPQEPYILCYFIGDHPSYWQKAASLAQATGLPVRVIPRTEGARQSGHELEENVPPQRWLALINGAAHIVTDSFHGAAFASILNRPCHILRRYREDDPESKNSRIDQLLRTIGVKDLADADWDAVNAHLSLERERGVKWLQEAITQAAP